MYGMSSNSSSDTRPPPFREGTPSAGGAESTALCSGASFSIYVLRELIGAGSMANVYRAHDARLRREVALKVLNPGGLPGADGLARFLHEARMAACVRHPNVVSIFDVGVHDGAPYIVMELLEGESLETRLSLARSLREPVLIDLALQLVSGLAAVHDAGVVHRDVRPSNVFVARGPGGVPQAKLLDFSISKQTRDNLRLTTNGRRRWAAMPLYTAPEVLLDGDATPHSDQYSLGVLLYECVTGVNPFRAETTRESIERIITAQARPAREQPIRPSRRLAAIIDKAMHVYPERRFANLRELGEALASLSSRRALWPWSGALAPAVAPTASAPRAASAPAPTERRLGTAIGVAVIGCSIAAPVWAWWSVHRRAAAPVSVAAPLAPSSESAPAPPAALALAPAANESAPESPAAESPGAESLGAGSLGSMALVSATPEPGAAPAALAPGELPAGDLPAGDLPFRELPPDAPPGELSAGELPAGERAAEWAPGSSAPGDDGTASESAPLLDAPAAAEGAQPAIGADAGAAPAADAGEPGAHDPAALSAPKPAAEGAHERGTNGALIFD